MREGTELLADRVAGPLTPEQQEIRQILDSSSRNLQKLIEQLLDYNRKQADGPVAREAVDLVDLVENVVAAHSLPARAKLMHTELTLQARRCLAEPALLISVMDNLTPMRCTMALNPVTSVSIATGTESRCVLMSPTAANRSRPRKKIRYSSLFTRGVTSVKGPLRAVDWG